MEALEEAGFFILRHSVDKIELPLKHVIQVVNTAVQSGSQAAQAKHKRKREGGPFRCSAPLLLRPAQVYEAYVCAAERMLEEDVAANKAGSVPFFLLPGA